MTKRDTIFSPGYAIIALFAILFIAFVGGLYIRLMKRKQSYFFANKEEDLIIYILQV